MLVEELLFSGFFYIYFHSITFFLIFLYIDVYDKTGEIIIYDLILDFRRLNISTHLHEKDGFNPNARYYFLQMNANPNEIVLLSRNTRHQLNLTEPIKQLFKKVPRGFKYNSDIFLFDSTRGCVVVLHDLPYNLEENTNEIIILNRTNIPYEQYFDCSGMVFGKQDRLDPNRCEVNDETSVKVLELVYNVPRTTPFFEVTNTSSVFTLTLILFVLAILICFIIYFVYNQISNRVSNSDNSDSLLILEEAISQLETKRSPSSSLNKSSKSPNKTATTAIRTSLKKFKSNSINTNKSI